MGRKGEEKKEEDESGTKRREKWKKARKGGRRQEEEASCQTDWGWGGGGETDMTHCVRCVCWRVRKWVGLSYLILHVCMCTWSAPLNHNFKQNNTNVRVVCVYVYRTCLSIFPRTIVFMSFVQQCNAAGVLNFHPSYLVIVACEHIPLFQLIHILV